MKPFRMFMAAGLLAAAVMGGGIPASAANYPERPVEFIYPFAPGSSTDAAWRLIGEDAGTRLGSSVVQINKPGAGGEVGIGYVLHRPPDGYTIGMLNNVVAVWQPLMDASFHALEPGRDFTPIACCIGNPLVLVTRPGEPFHDLASLIAYAKANPGKLKGSSVGVGTGGHLGLVMLNQLAGIDIRHVPYSGAGPALTAVLDGEVDVSLVDGAVKPQIDAGKLVGLVYTGDERWSLLPNVPTGAEAGLPGFKIRTWLSVVGPPHMPKDIVARLNDAYNAALTAPDVIAKIAPGGVTATHGPPSSLATLIKTDRETWRPIIAKAGIKLN